MGSLKELSIEDEFYFQWHITERCNKHCRHCYQDDHPSLELPLNDLFLILNKMDEALQKWGRRGSLSLTGGEPFIRESDLFALMHRIDNMDSIIYYDILTNGTLISDDIVQRFADLRKLRRIQVSLEGSSQASNDAIRGEGSFEETLSAIHRIKERGLSVSVMTTINRLNYLDIPGIFDLLKSEGVDTFALERLIPEGHGKELADQLLSPGELQKLYESIYQMAIRSNSTRVLLYRPLFASIVPEDPTVGALCSAGNNSLTIMPDGTVYPCRRLPISIGNVLTDGFFSIWYNSEVLWNIRNPQNLEGRCKECGFLASCRGCRAMAYFCSGNYMAEDPQCWL